MIWLLILSLFAPAPPLVDVCEINAYKNNASEFTQVILWRWQHCGFAAPDHYVAEWSMISEWSAVRCGDRYHVRWKTTQGRWRSVLARTLRETAGPIDPETADRRRLPSEARRSYLEPAK